MLIYDGSVYIHKCVCVSLFISIYTPIYIKVRRIILYANRLMSHGLCLRVKSYVQAVRWYALAVGTVQEDECGEFDAIMDTPLYELKSKMAELYLSGGHGLEKDASYAGDDISENFKIGTDCNEVWF